MQLSAITDHIQYEQNGPSKADCKNPAISDTPTCVAQAALGTLAGKVDKLTATHLVAGVVQTAMGDKGQGIVDIAKGVAFSYLGNKIEDAQKTITRNADNLLQHDNAGAAQRLIHSRNTAANYAMNNPIGISQCVDLGKALAMDGVSGGICGGVGTNTGLDKFRGGVSAVARF